MILSWNSHNDAEMCYIIRTSGLELDDDDTRLVKRIYDDFDVWHQGSNVYELFRLNNLVNQAIGWAKAKGTYQKLCDQVNSVPSASE